LSEFKGNLWSLRPEDLTRIEGRESDQVKAFSSRKLKAIGLKNLIGRLREQYPEMPQFTRSTENPGKLFHQRRVCEDGQILFLVNTSLDGSEKGEVMTAGGGVENWNLTTGQSEPYAFTTEGGKVCFSFSLPPAGVHSDSKRLHYG
jgi:hypothetical protein